MDDESKIIEEDVELVSDEEGEMPDLQARIKRLKAERAVCDKERKEYLDGWQRAKADLINYKKDEGRRLEDTIQYATARMSEDLLPVLDSFDMATAHGALQDNGGGVAFIRAQLADILKKRGVEEIAVSAGDAFNPEKHESIGEGASDHPAGSIAEVLQKGYTLAGRIIRPARVKLSKGRSE